MKEPLLMLSGAKELSPMCDIFLEIIPSGVDTFVLCKPILNNYLAKSRRTSPNFSKQRLIILRAIRPYLDSVYNSGNNKIKYATNLERP